MFLFFLHGVLDTEVSQDPFLRGSHFSRGLCRPCYALLIYVFVRPHTLCACTMVHVAIYDIPAAYTYISCIWGEFSSLSVQIFASCHQIGGSDVVAVTYWLPYNFWLIDSFPRDVCQDTFRWCKHSPIPTCRAGIFCCCWFSSLTRSSFLCITTKLCLGQAEFFYVLQQITARQLKCPPTYDSSAFPDAFDRNYRIGQQMARPVIAAFTSLFNANLHFQESSNAWFLRGERQSHPSYYGAGDKKKFDI